MSALSQDTLLGDRYRLTRRIAVGGMGEVWRAEDTVLHRAVAVKVLKSELLTDPLFLERFRTEARTTAALSHPGIASVFDYGEAKPDGEDDLSVAYLVMEFVDGEPLSAILAREGRLAVPRVLDIVRQTAAALQAAHNIGMVHRDIKPGNLLVRPDGMIKVTDFGIARATDAVPLTQSGMVVGTAQYFSPEQAEGRQVTATSDVYSLGVVAYECLAGRLPFIADSPVVVAMMQIRDTPPPLPPDVPGPVQALVARAMAKDLRQRFATGGALADAVRAVQEGRYDDRNAVSAPGPGGAAATLTQGTGSMPVPQARSAAVPAAPPNTGQGPGPGHVAPSGPMPGPGPSGPVSGQGPGPMSMPQTGAPQAVHTPPVAQPSAQVPVVAPAPPPVTGPPPVPAGPPSLGHHSTGTHQFPPLQQPPPPPVYRRRSRWPLWLAFILVLLLGGAAAAYLIQERGGPNDSGESGQLSPTPASSAPGNTERMVYIAPNEFRGLDLDTVIAELRGRGLDPVPYVDPGATGNPGTVVNVSPVGSVRVGSKVSVVVVPPEGSRYRMDEGQPETP